MPWFTSLPKSTSNIYQDTQQKLTLLQVVPYLFGVGLWRWKGEPRQVVIFKGTVGHKSHDPCLHVFLMEARVMTFAAHCTPTNNILIKRSRQELSKKTKSRSSSALYPNLKQVWSRIRVSILLQRRDTRKITHCRESLYMVFHETSPGSEVNKHYAISSIAYYGDSWCRGSTRGLFSLCKKNVSWFS